MTIICNICHEDLTESPRGAAIEEAHMVAMKCGHLFHYVCIQQWFQSSAERIDGPSGCQRKVLDGNCPCCMALVSLTHSIKIFPTGSEEVHVTEEQIRDLNAAQVKNKTLVGELVEIDEEIKHATKLLQEEVAAHDLLKVKYAESLSKIQGLEEQVLDNENILIAVRNSFRSELEKVEKEKNDALDDITRHIKAFQI